MPRIPDIVQDDHLPLKHRVPLVSDADVVTDDFAAERCGRCCRVQRLVTVKGDGQDGTASGTNFSLLFFGEHPLHKIRTFTAFHAIALKDIWIRSGVRSTKLAARREQQGAQGSTRHKRSAPGNICSRARPTNQDPLVRLMNSFGQKCHASWQLSPLFCPLPCFFEKSSIADWSFPCSGARS